MGTAFSSQVSCDFSKALLPDTGLLSKTLKPGQNEQLTCSNTAIPPAARKCWFHPSSYRTHKCRAASFLWASPGLKASAEGIAQRRFIFFSDGCDALHATVDSQTKSRNS